MRQYFLNNHPLFNKTDSHYHDEAIYLPFSQALCGLGIGPIMQSLEQVVTPAACQSHAQVGLVLLSGIFQEKKKKIN